MSAVENPVQLNSLSTKTEGVIDAINRAIVGIDTNDETIYNSAWTKDGQFVRGDINETSSSKELFDRVSKLDTHHTLSNMRVQFGEDPTTAYMTCYGLAQHHRMGEGVDPSKIGFLAGTTYYIDLMEEGKLWKIKEWYLKVNWCQGDVSVMTGH